jgi:flagellar protein FlgJ
MIRSPTISDKLAIDSKGLDDLKQAAKTNSPESLKAAATQFEALFLSMMMKSMREAGGQDGMFDSEQSKMYTSMFDQQLSQKMASRGIGLADAMLRQMTQQSMSQVVEMEKIDRNPTETLNSIAQYAQLQKMNVVPVEHAIKVNPSSPAHVQNFVNKLAAHAEQASLGTGIPAKFMLGQAALESGWGKREIKGIDGNTSHNILGIKASPNWKGQTVDALTTEYVNGVAYQKVEKFRAYDNYADAFKDYAKLISENPRYQHVLQSGGDANRFASELQKAGYATDPHYAQKLASVIKLTSLL